MSKNFVILLPPSEGKEAGGKRKVTSGAFDAQLRSARSDVRDALGVFLKSASKIELEKLLKVRGPLLERAVESSQLIAAGKPLLLPAYQRYSGVVWEHLAPDELSASKRKQLLIPSGLYGLSMGEDLIADYRLKMDVNLAGIGILSKFWKPFVTATLIKKYAKTTIVNLLPKEHEASIDFEELARHSHVVTIDFVDSSGSGAAGHAAKAAKGKVARWLLDEGLASFADFTWEGWKVSQKKDKFIVRAPKAKK